MTHVNGLGVRVWNGVTEKGVKCILFITRIAVPNALDNTEFEEELKQADAICEYPLAIPTRMII